MKDANRGLTFKSGTLDWKKDLAICTFADASLPPNPGLRANKDESTTCLTMPPCMRDPQCWSSSTIKRVCQATFLAETYALQAAVEAGDRLRIGMLEMFGKLGSDLAHCDLVSHQLMRHSWYSDCRSLTGHLSARVPRPVTDKRLGIELASLRQSVWTSDDVPTHEDYAPYGDTLSWIPTRLQLADAFTKPMKPNLLNTALDGNTATVREMTS